MTHLDTNQAEGALDKYIKQIISKLVDLPKQPHSWAFYFTQLMGMATLKSILRTYTEGIQAFIKKGI